MHERGNSLHMCVGLPGLAFLLCVTFPISLSAQPSGLDGGWDPMAILGSKHDLTSLNRRANTQAMEGVAYVDYGDACVYCHIPPEAEGSESAPEQIAGWNRIRPAVEGYELYDSPSFRSTAQIPNEVTLLCLSCHDGTMAVDRIVNTPRAWKNGGEMTMHMRLNASADLNSCGLCHDGWTAHDLGNKHIGTDLRSNHPVSVLYPGLALSINSNVVDKRFKTPRDESGFSNGVRLFNGFVECASCHDVHNPSNYKLLRARGASLCSTCHHH